MSQIPVCLSQRWVFLLPEPVFAFCKEKNKHSDKHSVIWSWKVFFFFLPPICLMVCSFFFAKSGSESGRNPKGASLLDITTVFLSTLFFILATN